MLFFWVYCCREVGVIVVICFVLKVLFCFIVIMLCIKFCIVLLLWFWFMKFDNLFCVGGLGGGGGLIWFVVMVCLVWNIEDVVDWIFILIF